MGIPPHSVLIESQAGAVESTIAEQRTSALHDAQQETFAAELRLQEAGDALRAASDSLAVLLQSSEEEATSYLLSVSPEAKALALHPALR